MKTIKTNFFLFFFLISFVSADIEEVIVKGDWREIKLIEEDSSVLVLGSKELELAPIKHFENLSYLIPNLNFAASDSRARHFQIRGIGERSGYERTPNSAVGFLIDDIDYSGQGGIATTFDVDQIEVHRGPQGSRIGSNAMAGLIYIKTKEPTGVYEGVSEITTGAYGTINTGVAFGGPSKIDGLTYRIALRQDYSDGFRKNLYSGKSDTSKKDESTFRIKANWEINDKSTIKFLATQVFLDDPADIWTIDGSLHTLSDRPGMDSQKTNAYGIKFYYQAHNFEFQSLTSMTETDVVLSYDADWGNSDTHAPYIYDYFSETLRFKETFSQEFRFLSDAADLNINKQYEWVIGVNFFESKEDNLKKDEGIYFDPLYYEVPYVEESSLSSNFLVNNFSIFGNLNYLINQSTKLTIGARWEDSESQYSDSLGESFNPVDKISGGKLSINKILDKDTNIFFSVAKGYNQGGFNLNLGLDPNSQNGNLYYDPEFLINYEIGLNSKIEKFNLNLAAVIFHSDRKDQQVLISTQVDPNNPNAFTFLTQNAAEGVNNGIELEMDIKLSENLDMFINFGLLKTEIKSWKSRPEIEGRAQAHAPEKSYAIGFNLYPSEQSNLSFDMVGKSSFYYSDSHDNKSKSYFLTNINYSYFSGQWTYSIWGRNIFDEYYSTRGFYFGNEAPNFIDTLYERHGDPRHLGVTVRYDF
jgi:outer membrane receptor protein involved in Fe transport